MNKKDIVYRLKADLKNAEYILYNNIASDDSKMRLEAIVGYIENMLLRIELKQDGKV